MNYELQVGDFFVSSSGFGKSWKDNVLANLVRFGTNSKYNHAGIYVGDNKVVEAQPGGVRFADVEIYSKENTLWSKGAFISTSLQREQIKNAALKMIGIPYGVLDIIAIALAQTKLGSVVDMHKAWEFQPWWVRRLIRKDRLICSQAVDEAYRLANIHLFNDGRLPQLVSPGDLGRLLGD